MLKFISGVVLLLVAVVGAAVLSLRANVPERTFELRPTAAPANPAEAAPVLVFGGTRGTGLELVRRLRARGEPVVAFVRPNSDTAALEALGARLVTGDAMEPETVRAALEQGPYRAVVSTIGCLSCEPPPDFIGNRNVIDAARAAGVGRLVLITSIGAGDSAGTAPWPSRLALRKILPLKTQAEEHLKESGLDYTIIRPGGLSPSPVEAPQPFLSEDPAAFGFIHREDLAALIVGVLDDPRTIDRTFAAADRARTTPWN